MYTLLLIALAGCGAPTPPLAAADVPGWPAAADVRHRVVLIGDGGELCPAWMEDCAATSDPLLDAARAAARAVPSAGVVWLGDNVYEAGATGVDDVRARDVLARQVAVADRPADVTFVPGNHDWAQSLGVTRHRIDAQRRILEEQLGARARAFPREGLADRVAEWEPAADGRLTVLYLDTERLLKRPHLRAAAMDTVREALAQGRPTLVAAHHPVVTDGKHGRWNGYSGVCVSSDLAAPCYRDWNALLVGTLAGSPTPALLAAGHDHDVQLRREVSGWSGWQLVSGAAAHATCGEACEAGALPSLHTPYEGPGFGILDVLDGGYRLTVVRLVRGAKDGCVPVGSWSACSADAGDPFASGW